MIEEPPLLTVRRRTRRPTEAQLAAFRDVPTGIVVDAMDGRGALWAAVAPLDHAEHVAGPALTAENGPADVLATLAALRFVEPGDVLVVATGGHEGAACAGDRVAGMLRNAGGAALVADGPMRDAAGIARVGLPVWCTGLTPASPFAAGPGRVGVPVQVGGRQVADGDVVVADRDGVVVVPWAEIDAVAARIPQVAALEAALDAEVEGGRRTADPVEALLDSDRTRWID